MASLLPALFRRLALYIMLILALLCNKLGLILLDMIETYVQALTALPTGRCLTTATLICLCTPAIVSIITHTYDALCTHMSTEYASSRPR